MKHYICLEDYKGRMKPCIEKAGLQEAMGMLDALTVAEGLPTVTKADICGEYAKKVQATFADSLDSIKAKPQMSKDEEHIVRAGVTLMEIMADTLAEMEK